MELKVKIQNVLVQTKMDVISDGVSPVDTEEPKMLLYSSNVLKYVITLVLKTISPSFKIMLFYA